MAVETGYRKGTRIEKEGAPSADFGPAIEKVLSSGPEPDAQAELDGRRLMERAPTADLSGMDPRVLVSAIAGAMGGRSVSLPCGCKPGIGVCLDRRDLAERIRRAKRRAVIRNDRGPLREAEAELREHLADQGWGRS